MHNGLDHPEIDMLKEQNETTEQESNLFAVMDEHIPSPPEIEAEDVLVLPEIQSMTDYIRLHFEEKLVEELSRRLRCGELVVPSGGRLYQELPWAGVENDEAESGPDPGSQEPKDGVPAVWEDPRFSAPGVRVAGVRPKKGAIVWFNYRRVAECGVEADLTLEMEIELRWYTLRKTVCQRYDVDVWFDMEEDIAADYGNFRIHRHRGEKPGVRLDDYLAPVFGWEDIEKEAEQIIFQIAPEGLQDPQWLHPGLFAERLGLRLLNLPLYRRPRTASILFFGPGEALTASEENGDKAPPVPVQVEANTIVINSRCIGKERGAVFHECFHFMEHRLFFHLQRLHCSDVARLGQWKPVALEKNGRSPIEWIEWQAHGGGLCLQAPRTLLRKRVAEELNGLRHMRRHMGYKLELVGKKLAKEFGICNYQLRNRMIQVGYGENGEFSDDVRIILNSYGGSCNAAVRMHDDIRAYPGKVHLVISGTAASAATVLSAAADTLEMTPGSLYMIHDPSTVAWGNERDFSEAIALLKACKASILNIYSRRSPIDRGTLAAMMTATTWMDAGAALAQGFIDGVADPQTCPTDSSAVRTVNRKDAEAKVRLWLERHNPLKQGKMVQKPAAEDKTAPELSVADYQKQTSQKVQTHENPGIPADQLRRRLDLIKPNDR